MNGDFGEAARNDADGPATPLGKSIVSSHLGDRPTLSPQQQREAGEAYLAARDLDSDGDGVACESLR